MIGLRPTRRWSGSWVLSLAVLGLWLACTQGVAATGNVLYRYVDEAGAVVLDDHVPPAVVHRGYTVLAPDGRVIREVPASLEADQAAAQRAAEAEAARMRAWDESLLRRYSTVEDIEAARERALNEINVRLEILRSNLLSIKSQIEREQSRAADLERRGIPVPEDLLETIRVLQREIDDTEDTIAQRHRDVEEVRASYQKDIQRFQALLERLQLRRRGGEG